MNELSQAEPPNRAFLGKLFGKSFFFYPFPPAAQTRSLWRKNPVLVTAPEQKHLAEKSCTGN